MELARIGTKSAFENSGDYLEISKRNKILRLFDNINKSKVKNMK